MIKPTTLTVALASIYGFAQGEILLNTIDHTRDLRSSYTAYDDQIEVDAAQDRKCTNTCDPGFILDKNTCDCDWIGDDEFDLAASPCMKTCEPG